MYAEGNLDLEGRGAWEWGLMIEMQNIYTPEMFRSGLWFLSFWIRIVINKIRGILQSTDPVDSDILGNSPEKSLY